MNEAIFESVMIWRTLKPLNIKSNLLMACIIANNLPGDKLEILECVVNNAVADIVLEFFRNIDFFKVL